jgi:hypothetical protein
VVVQRHVAAENTGGNGEAVDGVIQGAGAYEPESIAPSKIHNANFVIAYLTKV